jgi:hypothetical protein
MALTIQEVTEQLSMTRDQVKQLKVDLGSKITAKDKREHSEQCGKHSNLEMRQRQAS